MKLNVAKICLNDDCEEIFDGPRCPACGSDYFFPLERWLNPAVRQSNEWIDAIIEYQSIPGGAAGGRTLKGRSRSHSPRAPASFPPGKEDSKGGDPRLDVQKVGLRAEEPGDPI